MRAHFVLAASALVGAALPAQDIEVLAEQRGRKLPRAYYEIKAREPDAFELKGGWRNKLAMARANASVVKGTLPLVIIPALFSDSEQPDATIASSAIQTKLFNPAGTSTVTAYYNEVSRGNLLITGHVTQWVPTSFSRALVVGQSFGLGADARTRDWLRDAIAKVDVSIDFGQFDNDGPDGIPNSGDDDGRVDGAAFLFRELDAACGGNGPWPHRHRFSAGGFAPPITNDPRPNGQMIVLDDFMVMGARNCGGTRPLDVNVFAHETGHVLGLPDYYDASGGLLREQRRWVVGCWDIMSAGSWGCGAGPHPEVIQPPHMGPFPKAVLGWIEPKAITVSVHPERHVLRAAFSSGDALRIPLSEKEYLLVEYRAKQSHDASIPASGLVVYHIETDRSFLPCPVCPRTYSYALMEADGDSALVKVETAGGNRGAATDAFGGTRNVIDDSTIPSSRLNNGVSTWVKLSAMVVDVAQGVARLTVSLSPPWLTVQNLVAALGRTPLPAENQAILDRAGNGNGRFDVGDLRAYLRAEAGAR